MKKYTGSIVKRGEFFHWRFKTADGKYTTRAVKHPEGGRVTTMADAERVVTKWSAELAAIHRLKSREEVIQQIAEVKELLHVCKDPIEKIEEVFFAHPSAPEISPQHRGNYHSVLQRLIRFASGRGIKTVAEVTEEVAQDFLSYNWKRGISAKTYNSNLDVLRRVFRLICKDQNPFAEFKKKPSVTETRQAFTVEQLKQLWETLESPDFHILYKNEMEVLYKLALYTGARCGDLCLLKWSSVDLEQRLIRFTPHKTAHTSHRRVEIPMSEVLYSTLINWPQTSEYVLPQVANRYQRNPSGISHDTKRLIEAAGFQATDAGESRRLRNVSRLGFHAFRHSYVSMLIANGVNPLVVRDLVGHTTVDMTSRYTHVSLATKQQAVDTLAIPSLSGNLALEDTCLAEQISSLSRNQIYRLAGWFSDHLSQKQKQELKEMLNELSSK